MIQTLYMTRWERDRERAIKKMREILCKHEVGPYTTCCLHSKTFLRYHRKMFDINHMRCFSRIMTSIIEVSKNHI